MLLRAAQPGGRGGGGGPGEAAQQWLRRCRSHTSLMPTSSPVDMWVPVGPQAFDQRRREGPCPRRCSGVQATESTPRTPGRADTPLHAAGKAHDLIANADEIEALREGPHACAVGIARVQLKPRLMAIGGAPHPDRCPQSCRCLFSGRGGTVQLCGCREPLQDVEMAEKSS